MADWNNPNEASWLAAIGTVVASAVALGIALYQGWQTRRTTTKERDARAWQQAILMQPILMRIKATAWLLSEECEKAVKAQQITPDGREKRLMLRDVESLAALLPGTESLDEPLRTNVLQLVAWGREWNRAVESCTHEILRNPPFVDATHYIVDAKLTSAGATLFPITKLIEVTNACVADTAKFIAAKASKSNARLAVKR